MVLLLLPNVLGSEADPRISLPAALDQVMEGIDGLIAESEKGGRTYLKRFKTKKKPHHMPIALLNEHTSMSDLDFLLEPIKAGETWGVVSDGGLPCLADPGAALVRRARQLNIPVEAFSGPSSITHALMLSGLSGQSFTFHGYIGKDRKKDLREWEKRAQQEGVTQIFIETPYRNEVAFQDCIDTLQGQTLLCVATDLTLPTQEVSMISISKWKKRLEPHLSKRPTIFLFAAPLR